MRNIVSACVDDHLIHGEAVTAWIPSLSAKRIVTVDDTVAADKFNKRVLVAPVPQGTKVAVLPAEGVTKALRKSDLGNERAIVLMKTPIVFEQLPDDGIEIREVYLGGTGIRGDRKPFINNASASPDEVDSIHHMRNGKGVSVYYQLVPEREVVDMSNLL